MRSLPLTGVVVQPYAIQLRAHLTGPDEEWSDFDVGMEAEGAKVQPGPLDSTRRVRRDDASNLAVDQRHREPSRAGLGLVHRLEYRIQPVVVDQVEPTAELD